MNLRDFVFAKAKYGGFVGGSGGGSGGGGGGGSSADVCYVTFMSYDGSVEYGKKAVAIGDDCANPISRGVFTTPTRESDVQYNYTFYGWATEPNGAANSSWNKAVTEDKTVYANFSKTVRYYTVTYYDTDGTTVLKTESLAYGSTPVYVPEKEGYGFTGWEPSLTSVTEDAAYCAQWTELVVFANASWADIARISEEGTATQHFKIGDTKDVTLSDGEVITIEIIAFNHDVLADGSGKAGITVLTNHVLENPVSMNSTATNSGGWASSQLRTSLNSGDINALLPDTLKAVVKPVTKKTTEPSDEYTRTDTTDSFWILSTTEAGYTGHMSGQGNRYGVYSASSSTSMMSTKLVKKLKSDDDSITTRLYWLRTPHYYRNSTSFYAINFNDTNNAPSITDFQANSTLKVGNSVADRDIYLVFGFCI